MDYTAHWYQYPLDILQGKDPSTWFTGSYTELCYNPLSYVSKISKHFSFPESELFRTFLIEENQRQQSYKSKHKYSLEDFGMTAEGIESTFPKIFETFGPSFTDAPPIKAA